MDPTHTFSIACYPQVAPSYSVHEVAFRVWTWTRASQIFWLMCHNEFVDVVRSATKVHISYYFLCVLAPLTFYKKDVKCYMWHLCRYLRKPGSCLGFLKVGVNHGIFHVYHFWNFLIFEYTWVCSSSSSKNKNIYLNLSINSIDLKMSIYLSISKMCSSLFSRGNQVCVRIKTQSVQRSLETQHY